MLCLCARLYICALWSSAVKGLASCLLFVVSYCEFVAFPLVSCVRYGIRLYRFLIFTPLFTLTMQHDQFLKKKNFDLFTPRVVGGGGVSEGKMFTYILLHL